MARGKNAGNKGQGSKWISRARRRRIYERDGWKCVWCQVRVCDIPGCPKHPVVATLDHIVSRSAGGSNATNNLITCCMGCNRLRGNSDWSKFALLVGRSSWDHLLFMPAPRGSQLAALTKPIRKRIRTVLNTEWGF